MPAVITPFGRSHLLVASFHNPVVKALEKFIRLFLGPHLPINFPENGAITLTCIEDLHTRLDSLERREIFSTVCVVDCSGETLDNVNQNTGNVRINELVLRYPEIYWIFLWDNNIPAGLTLCNNNLHFITLQEISALISLLTRHSFGFRPYFDPTGLRSALRKICTSAEAVRHSAPYFSQSIAQVLLKRANAIMYETDTTEEAVHGAILAREAWLILNGKTHSLCLEALEILHKMEAMAECSFLGASSELRVENRFNEIEQQVKHLLENIAFSHKADIKERQAIVIDEEEKFCLMNGYCLYRYGFNTDIIPSKNEFELCAKDVKNVTIILEDVDIMFGDAEKEFQDKINPNGCGIAEKLNLRSKNYPYLADATKRIFISTDDAEEELNNIDHNKSIQRIGSIIKPYGGVFDEGLCVHLKDLGFEIEHDSCFGSVPPFKEPHKNFQLVSALIEIVSDLRSIYKNYDQCYEEDRAIIRIRDYARKLKYKNYQSNHSKTVKSLIWVTNYVKLIGGKAAHNSKKLQNMFELYFNWITKAFTNIVATIINIIIIFAIYYALVMPVNQDGCKFYLEWLLHSFVTFFALQPGIINNLNFNLLNMDNEYLTYSSYMLFWLGTATEMLIGYVHLGIMIAYLYQKISRK